MILDAGVLIAAERGRVDLEVLAARDDDVCIAAVTAAELLHGIERADQAHAPARQKFADGIPALLPVEDYTLDVARVHARLLSHVRRSGKPRGAHDLNIAATGAATARSIITTDDEARFGDLPGVTTVPLG